MSNEENALISTSLADQVYERVEGEILSGRLKMGERISEDGLASRFGVSRTPAREALRRLGEFGLVDIEPRSYIRVIIVDEKRKRELKSIFVALMKYSISYINESDNINCLLDNAGSIVRDLERDLAEGRNADFILHDSALLSSIATFSSSPDFKELFDRVIKRLTVAEAGREYEKNQLKRALSLSKALIESIKSGDARKSKSLIEKHMDTLI